ncbi:MAG TPA: Sir2 family NAD-dependent protein deacetylase [Candidatus Thermoplasmatota archaeon]|nr:Sir2 family NAD-dependent protein deacetylase [Candidatus Thermoplasmatota archaeon]
MDDAIRALARAERVLAFTGAGVSTASGIPDFRGPDGLWKRFDPAEFEYDRLVADPSRFWTLRAKLEAALNLEAARPNAAHRALAAAEGSGRLVGVVTQNVDGLHLAAGTSPERLVELHGAAREVQCLVCRARHPVAVAREDLARGRVPPRCPACGGALKPGVTLFGETLDAAAWARADAFARRADIVLVVGSSLGVYPAALVPRRVVEAGGGLVIVNREPTPFDDDADALVREDVATALPRLMAGAGLVR